MFRKKYSSIIVVLSLLLVASVAGMAFAGSGTSSGTDNDSLYQEYLAKFAANLGIEQDKVAAAMETTKKQMLTEAVQRGDITQEQADKMAIQKDPGGFRMFGGGSFDGKRGPHGRGFMGQDTEKILGITQEQLREEMKSGKTWEQILSDQGLTLDQLHQRMLETRKESLAKDVAEGKITQNQADDMIERMQQRQESCPRVNN